ncbi:MAG: hypothetical protein DRI32_00450, partial [Chloroflexi bacterium]
MSATESQIAKVRRMVNEPDDTTYDDDAITEYIEEYPLVDENGESPRVPSSTSTGVMVNPDWTATYDLNAAASAIWVEKAAVLQQDYDFEADGGDYKRSQAYGHAMMISRHYGSRRSVKKITQV